MPELLLKKGFYQYNPSCPETPPQFKKNSAPRMRQKIDKLNQTLEACEQADYAIIKKHSLLPKVSLPPETPTPPKLIFANIHLASSLINSDLFNTKEGNGSEFYFNILNILSIYAEESQKCSSEPFFTFLNASSKPQQLKSLYQLKKFAKKFDAIPEKEKRIQEKAKFLTQKIANLKPGESYDILGGYEQEPVSHTAFYSFKKNHNDTYTIAICNAQKGSENIQGGIVKEGRPYTAPFLLFKNVPVQEIFFSYFPESYQSTFFEALVDVLENAVPEDSSPLDFLFVQLEKYCSKPDAPFIGAQKGENCFFHSFKALQHYHFIYNTPKDPQALTAYKRFIFQFKLISLIHTYQTWKNNLLSDSQAREMLKFGALGLIRHYRKSFEKNILDPHLATQGLYTAIDLLNKVKKINSEALFEKGELQVISTETDQPCLEVAKKKLNNLLNFPFLLDSKKEHPGLPIPSFTSINSITSGIELKKALQNVDNTASLLMNQHKELFALIEIERLVDNLPFSLLNLDEPKIKKGLKHVPSLLASILDRYISLIEKEDVYSEAKCQNCLYAMIAFMEQTIQILEKRKGLLSSYAVNPIFFQTLSSYPQHVLTDPVEVKRRQYLLNYFCQNQKDKTPAFWFKGGSFPVKDFKNENLPFYKDLIRNDPALKENIENIASSIDWWWRMEQKLSREMSLAYLLLVCGSRPILNKFDDFLDSTKNLLYLKNACLNAQSVCQKHPIAPPSFQEALKKDDDLPLVFCVAYTRPNIGLQILRSIGATFYEIQHNAPPEFAFFDKEAFKLTESQNSDLERDPEKIENENEKFLNREQNSLFDFTKEISLIPYQALSKFDNYIEKLSLIEDEEASRTYQHHFLLFFFKAVIHQEKELHPLVAQARKNPFLHQLFAKKLNVILEKLVLTQPEKKPRLKSVLFALNFAQKLASLSPKKGQGSKYIASSFFESLKMASLQQVLESWLDMAFSKAEKLDITTQIVIELSNLPLNEKTAEDWANLFFYRGNILKANYHHPEMHSDPLQMLTLHRNFADQLDYFEMTTPKFQNQVCQFLFYKETGRQSSIPFNKSKFPLFVAKSKDKEEFVAIDCLTMQIITEKGILNSGVTQNFNSDEFRRVFKSQMIVGKTEGSAFEFKDPLFGLIKIANISTPFQQLTRCYKGNTLQFIPYDEVKNTWLLQGVFSTDYSCWVNWQHHILYLCNLNSGKIDFKFKNNRLISSETQSEIEFNFNTDLISQFFEGFESGENIYFEIENATRTKICLPRFKTPLGNQLEFRKGNDGHFFWSENLNFRLVPQNDFSPFGKFRGYVCLEHKDAPENKIYLLPPFPFEFPGQSFEKVQKHEIPQINTSFRQVKRFSFQILNTSIAISKSLNPELAAKTAYLFLGQRKYTKALQFLMHVNEEAYPSSESIDYLVSILFAPLELKDPSGNAYALALRALIKLKKLCPFKESFESYYQQLEIPFERRNITTDTYFKLFEEYFIRINSVNHPLRLQKKDIGFLIKHFPIDHPCYVANWSRKIFTRKEKIFTLKTNTAESHPELWGKLDHLPPFPTPPLYLNFKLTEEEYQQRERYQFQKGYPYKNFPSDYAFLKDPHQDIALKQAFIYKLFLCRRPIENGYNEDSVLISLLKFAYLQTVNAPSLPFEEVNEKNINDLVTTVCSESNQTALLFLRQEPKTQSSSKYQTSPAKNPIEEAICASPHIGLQIKREEYTPEDPIEEIRKLIKEKKKPVKNRNLSNILSLKKEELRDSEINFEDDIKKELLACEWELIKGQELNQNRIFYQFPKSKDLEIIREKVCNEIDRLKNSTTVLEKLILRKANALPIEKLESIRKAAFLGKEAKKVKLMEVFWAFGAAREGESIDRLLELNPYLSKDLAQEILEDTILYLEDTTNLKQLENVDKNLKSLDDKKYSEKEILWEEASESLMSHRTYDPKVNHQALVFEALSGLRIRKDQAEILQKIINDIFSEHSNLVGVVFQLFMGGGKTSLILSQLLKIAAEKEGIPIFLCHPAQMSAVEGNLREFQGSRHGQEVTVIDFQSENQSNPLTDDENIQWIFKKIKKGIKNKHALIMKTTLLQALFLEFFSLVEHHPSEYNAAFEKKFHSISKILELFLKKGIGFFDEATLNLSLAYGVHRSEGTRKKLHPAHLNLIKNIFSILVSDREIKDLIQLETNNQSYHSEKAYREKVLPHIVKRLMTLQKDDFLLEEHHSEAFIRFASGHTLKSFEKLVLLNCPIKKQDLKNAIAQEGLTLESYPVKDAEKDIAFLKEYHIQLAQSKSSKLEKAADLIALTRRVLHKLLPITLSHSENKNYGRVGLEVAPYEGVGTPSHTRFADPIEECIYYFQTAASKGISSTQLKTMIAAKEKEALDETLPFSKTSAAKLFKEITGFSLNKIRKKDNFEKALENINSNKITTIHFEALNAKDHVGFFPYILSSSPISAINLVNRKIACSGLLWNYQTFHPDLKNNAYLIEGTEGQFLEKLLEDNLTGRSFIFEIETPSIASVLKGSYEKRKDKERIRGLIDAAGILKSYSDLEAAEAIIQFFDGKEKIEGVVFNFKNSSTLEEFHAVLQKIPDHSKKGYRTQFHRLNNSTKEEIKKCGIPLENLFFYYDHLSSIGTDYPQLPDAVNIVTFDFKSTIRSDWLQGAGRMRNILKHQNGDFVYPKESAKDLHKQCKDLTLIDLIKAASCNQKIQVARELYRSFLEQIKEIFRYEIYLYFLETARSRSVRHYDRRLIFKKIMTDCRSFVFDPVTDTPYQSSGRIPDFALPHIVLEEIFKKKRDQFLKIEIIRDIKGISEKIESKWVAIHQASKELQFLVERTESGFEESARVEVNTQQEVSTTLQTNLELKEHQYNGWTSPRTETIWSCIGPKELFSSYQGSLIEPISKQFEEDFSAQKSNTYYEEDYGKIFPKNLKLTKNFKKSAVGLSFSVFSKHQKEPGPILVTQTVEGSYDFILLSLAEAAYFKKALEKLSNSNFWLIGREGIPIPNQRAPLPPNTPFYKTELDKALFYIDFFDGDIKKLIDSKEQLQQSLQPSLYKIQMSYLDLKSSAKGENHYQIFKEHPLFQGKDFGQKITKKLAEAITPLARQNVIENLRDPDLLQRLAPHEFYFISPEAANLIPENRIQDLPFDKLEDLAAEKIGLLSDEQIPYLKLKKQIQAIEDHYPDKIKLLGTVSETVAVQLNLISDNKLNALSPEAIRQNLIFERVCHLTRPELIQALTPSQVQGVDPSCVSFLKSNFVNNLEEKEQIIALTDSQIPYLNRGKLLAWVPPDKSHLLSDDQIKILAAKVFSRPDIIRNDIQPLFQSLNRQQRELYLDHLSSSQIMILKEEDYHKFEKWHLFPQDCLCLIFEQFPQLVTQTPKDVLLEAISDPNHPTGWNSFFPDTAIPFLPVKVLYNLNCQKVAYQLTQKQVEQLNSKHIQILPLLSKTQKAWVQPSTIQSIISRNPFDYNLEILKSFYDEYSLPKEILTHTHLKQIPFLSKNNWPLLPQDLFSDNFYTSLSIFNQCPEFISLYPNKEIFKPFIRSLHEESLLNLPLEYANLISDQQLSNIAAMPLKPHKSKIENFYKSLSPEKKKKYLASICPGQISLLSEEDINQLLSEKIHYLSDEQLKIVERSDLLPFYPPEKASNMTDDQIEKLAQNEYFHIMRTKNIFEKFGYAQKIHFTKNANFNFLSFIPENFISFIPECVFESASAKEINFLIRKNIAILKNPKCKIEDPNHLISCLPKDKHSLLPIETLNQLTHESAINSLSEDAFRKITDPKVYEKLNPLYNYKLTSAQWLGLAKSKLNKQNQKLTLKFKSLPIAEKETYILNMHPSQYVNLEQDDWINFAKKPMLANQNDFKRLYEHVPSNLKPLYILLLHETQIPLLKQEDFKHLTENNLELLTTQQVQSITSFQTLCKLPVSKLKDLTSDQIILLAGFEHQEPIFSNRAFLSFFEPEQAALFIQNAHFSHLKMIPEALVPCIPSQLIKNIAYEELEPLIRSNFHLLNHPDLPNKILNRFTSQLSSNEFEKLPFDILKQMATLDKLPSNDLKTIDFIGKLPPEYCENLTDKEWIKIAKKSLKDLHKNTALEFRLFAHDLRKQYVANMHPTQFINLEEQDFDCLTHLQWIQFPFTFLMDFVNSNPCLISKILNKDSLEKCVANLSPEAVPNLPKEFLNLLSSPKQLAKIPLPLTKELKHPKLLSMLTPEVFNQLTLEQQLLVAVEDKNTLDTNCAKLVKSLKEEVREHYIGQIHPSQISLLCVDDFIYLKESEFKFLSNEQLNHFVEKYPEDATYLPDICIPRLHIKNLEKIADFQFEAISKEQLEMLDFSAFDFVKKLDVSRHKNYNFIIENMSDLSFKFLTPQQVQQFSGSLSSLRERFSFKHASFIRPSLLSKLNLEFDWDQRVLNNLSQEQLQCFDDDYAALFLFLDDKKLQQIPLENLNPNKWPKKVLQNLTYEKHQRFIQNLDENGLKKLNKDTLKEIPSEKMHLIQDLAFLKKVPLSSFSKLSKKQIAKLIKEDPKKYIPLVSDEQWNSIENRKIEKLPPEVKKRLPLKQISRLPLNEIQNHPEFQKNAPQIRWDQTKQAISSSIYAPFLLTGGLIQLAMKLPKRVFSHSQEDNNAFDQEAKNLVQGAFYKPWLSWIGVLNPASFLKKTMENE